jgi:hypothetical protein
MLKILKSLKDSVKISGKQVVFEVKNGELIVSGKKVLADLKIKTEGKIFHYFDNDGELFAQEGTSLRDFVQTLFRDKLLKFQGNKVVQNWK